MTFPNMEDQHDFMRSILQSSKEGDNSKAFAMVCELNKLAKDRGYEGENYWFELTRAGMKFLRS